MAERFEPLILAFCCNYCAYAAADLAGSMRLDYPPNVRIIRIPCSGKIDAQYILEGFLNGADGVLVVGCLEGDCHFKNGNNKAARRVAYVKKLLDEIGIGGERVEMVLMSAGMGERFARVAEEITEKIRKLGPNPVKITSISEAQPAA